MGGYAWPQRPKVCFSLWLGIGGGVGGGQFNSEVKETKFIRQFHLLVLMKFPCCGVVLGTTTITLGQKGTIQATF